MFMCEFGLEIEWISGERKDFWVSPSDFRIVVSVARVELLFVKIRQPKHFFPQQLDIKEVVEDLHI